MNHPHWQPSAGVGQCQSHLPSCEDFSVTTYFSCIFDLSLYFLVVCKVGICSLLLHTTELQEAVKGSLVAKPIFLPQVERRQNERKSGISESMTACSHCCQETVPCTSFLSVFTFLRRAPSAVFVLVQNFDSYVIRSKPNSTVKLRCTTVTPMLS